MRAKWKLHNNRHLAWHWQRWGVCQVGWLHRGQLESNDPRDVGLARAFQQSRRNCWKSCIDGSFADLAELCPLRANEMLNPEPDPQRFIILPGLEVARPKKKQVTDIISWSQCFLVYMAVMHKKFPDKVPNMIAYMLTIVRAQQEFEDPGWRIYDHNYRLKAAASGNQNWAELDYSQCFTGRAKKVPSCAKCNSFRHAQEDSPHGMPLAFKGGQIPEPSIPAESSANGQRPTGPRPGGKIRGGICFAFDWEGSCPYNPCKFRHMCSRCLGRHPSSQCRRSGKVVRRLGHYPEPVVKVLRSQYRNCVHRLFLAFTTTNLPSLFVH